MIRITIDSFRADYPSDAAEALHRIADAIAENEKLVMITNPSVDTIRYEVEELCEFCDGEGEINGKKCFNCNVDYDAEREGK